ncbi:MAG: ornithine cyclodeaminase family protein [Halobacteriaceae archaeon]
METRLLDSDDVADCAPLDAVVPAVEDAFAAYARDDVVMPAKSYVDLPEHGGDFRSMPAYVDAGEWEAAGHKWVNVHPDNRDRFDLPTVMGTMAYSDPRNGFLRSLMDGTELTMRRTGAAAAVATKHLAREDADSLGIVGAGVQAHMQLEAIATVRDVREVVVCDRNEGRVAAFVEAFEDRFDVRGGSVSEAGHCDVLSTVTPVEDPIVSPGDVGPTTHVNAIGADAPGKHELADDLLRDAKIVIDDYEQCTHSGEINVPWRAGVLGDADVHAELGDVVVGDSEGRTPEDGVTVFDSTGLAIQDVAAAHVAHENAVDGGVGTDFDLLGV